MPHRPGWQPGQTGPFRSVLLHGDNQQRDARDQPRVERRRQRPARSIQRRSKLGGNRYRQAGLLHQQVARHNFVHRISHAELRGHGKRFDVGPVAGCDVFKCGAVELCDFRAIVVMTARNALDHQPRKCRGKAGALHHGFIEPDQHDTHRRPMTLHHGIGGECR